MGYIITRQCQWPDGALVVEISEGGPDYTNPDALVRRFPGEFEEFLNPVEATETAIDIMKRWQKDENGQKIEIAYGHTLGFTMPFEASPVEEVRAWARYTLEQTPKCEWCNELIDMDKDTIEDEYERKYCSEDCAQKRFEADYKENEVSE